MSWWPPAGPPLCLTLLLEPRSPFSGHPEETCPASIHSARYFTGSHTTCVHSLGRSTWVLGCLVKTWHECLLATQDVLQLCVPPYQCPVCLPFQ